MEPEEYDRLRPFRRGEPIWIKQSALSDYDFLTRFDNYDILRHCIVEHLPFVSGFDSDGTWAGINRNKEELQAVGLPDVGPYHQHTHLGLQYMKHLSLTKPGIASKADMEALYD